MNIRETIFQIRLVYTEHIRWRSAIQAMHMGFLEYEKKIETDPEKTIFGLWYYGDGKKLSYDDDYQKLEQLNNKLHQIHNIILEIKKEEANKNFISKLNLEDKKLNKNMIAGYLKDFANHSKELLQTLKNIEQRFINMNSNTTF